MVNLLKGILSHPRPADIPGEAQPARTTTRGDQNAVGFAAVCATRLTWLEGRWPFVSGCKESVDLSIQGDLAPRDQWEGK